MVVSIEELANKYFSTETFNSIPIQMAKAPAYETIDINSNDDVKERTTSLENSSFRSYSVSSMASSVPYHKRMEINNNLLDKEAIEPINSSQLSYAESRE